VKVREGTLHLHDACDGSRAYAPLEAEQRLLGADEHGTVHELGVVRGEHADHLGADRLVRGVQLVVTHEEAEVTRRLFHLRERVGVGVGVGVRVGVRVGVGVGVGVRIGFGRGLRLVYGPEHGLLYHLEVLRREGREGERRTRVRRRGKGLPRGS
jgi:hypothetical protein